MPLSKIFLGAGLRKDAKVKAKSAFRTKYRDWKKANRGTPENFAVMLAEDISLRVKTQQMGFDKLLPASYLNGERWNDENQMELLRYPQAQTPSVGQVLLVRKTK